MKQDKYIISNTIKAWIKKNKIQLIIAFVLLCLGIIALNQYVGLMNKIDLLMQPCQLCTQQGYHCQEYIPFNITP